MKKVFLFLTGAAIFCSCTKEVSNADSKAPASMTENKATAVTAVDTIKNERQFILFWSGNKNLASDDEFFAAARRQALLVFDDGTTLSVDHSTNPYNRVYLTRTPGIGLGLNVVWSGNGFCVSNFKLLDWLIMDVSSGHTLRLHNLDTDKTAIVYQGTPMPSSCGSFIKEIDFKKFPKD